MKKWLLLLLLCPGATLLVAHSSHGACDFWRYRNANNQICGTYVSSIVADSCDGANFSTCNRFHCTCTSPSLDDNGDGTVNGCDSGHPSYDTDPDGDCDGNGKPNINEPDHPLHDPFHPQSDYDGDGIPNIEDTDPYDEWIYNPCDTQDPENYDYSKCANADFDFDGIPHHCDPEDGVDLGGFEPDETCPNVAELSRMDFDGDGIPNYKDPDSATDYPWAYDESTYGPNSDSDGDGIPNKNDPDSEVYDPNDPYSDADGDGIPNNEDIEESTEDQCPEGQVAASFGSNAYAAAASSSGSGSEIACVPVACPDTDMDGVCDHCDPFPNNPNYYTKYILAAAWLRGGKYCAYGYFEGTCVAGSSPSCKLWVKFNPDYKQYVQYTSDGLVASITGCTYRVLGNNPLNPRKCSQTCDSCSTAVETIDWAAPMTETPDASQTDSDGDGIMDNVDKDQTGGPDADGDGIDDNFDTFVDADKDGIDDRITQEDPTPGGTDADGDGVNDKYQATGSTNSDDVTAGALTGIAAAIDNLAEALGLESPEDPGPEDTFSPITNSSFQEGYAASGESLDFGSRFDSFLGKLRASALFGFSVSFFESVPSGGSPVFEVNGGKTFGRHTVDLDETMGRGLLALKGFMYVIFGFLSIRAIIMKR